MPHAARFDSGTLGGACNAGAGRGWEHEQTGGGEAGRSGERYDAAIVGASLAGCTAAIALGRAGARVALIEQRPEMRAFKRICSHFIQSSAVPTLERLGLLEPMERAGALRPRTRIWTRWGWIEPPADSAVPAGVNLRRELLDPLLRRIAAQTPGVELMLGYTAEELLRGEQGAFAGVRARARDGRRLWIGARLIVGADGRGSRVAKLAGVRTKEVAHGRFAYGGYFKGPAIAGAPDGSAWFLDPDWAAAFPTDGGLTFYACMPTKDRLPEFRRDPEAALRSLLEGLADGPPIASSRLVRGEDGASILGKLEMPNVARVPSAPGLALIGDAALAVDPLWGVGCGWALQSAEWLADSVAPVLADRSAPARRLERALARYRRRHARALGGHAGTIDDYAGGRKLNRGERLLFSAAARDERTARVFEAFGTRNIGPARMLATGVPLALAAHCGGGLLRRRPAPSRSAGTELAGTASREAAGATR